MQAYQFTGNGNVVGISLSVWDNIMVVAKKSNLVSVCFIALFFQVVGLKNPPLKK